MTDPRTIRAIADQIRRNTEWAERMAAIREQAKYRRRSRKQEAAKAPQIASSDQDRLVLS